MRELLILIFIVPFGIVFLYNENYIKKTVFLYRDIIESMPNLKSDKYLLYNSLFFPLQKVKNGMFIRTELQSDRVFKNLLKRIKLQKILASLMIVAACVISFVVILSM